MHLFGSGIIRPKLTIPSTIVEGFFMLNLVIILMIRSQTSIKR